MLGQTPKTNKSCFGKSPEALNATVPEYIIRAMQAKDEGEVLAMMRVFYASPTVLSNGTEDIFRRDLAFCLSDSPLLSGYIFAQ